MNPAANARSRRSLIRTGLPGSYGKPDSPATGSERTVGNSGIAEINGKRGGRKKKVARKGEAE